MNLVADFLNLLGHEPHAGNEDCAACHHRSQLDRLAAHYRDQFAELANILKAPINTVEVAGEPMFDTIILTDVGVPYPFLSKDRERVRITVLNSSVAAIVTLTTAPNLSPTGAGTFALAAGASVTLAVRGPLYAYTNVTGAILAICAVDVTER